MGLRGTRLIAQLEVLDEIRCVWGDIMRPVDSAVHEPSSAPGPAGQSRRVEALVVDHARGPAVLHLFMKLDFLVTFG